jgi:hypothetical protein
MRQQPSPHHRRRRLPRHLASTAITKRLGLRGKRHTTPDCQNRQRDVKQTRRSTAASERSEQRRGDGRSRRKWKLIDGVLWRNPFSESRRHPPSCKSRSPRPTELHADDWREKDSLKNSQCTTNNPNDLTLCYASLYTLPEPSSSPTMAQVPNHSHGQRARRN